ncbi:MAG: flap endonuclease-1, partial [archaeon]
MGVKISDIVPRRELSLSEIRGKTLAVDALNTLYQFLSIIRQYDGTPLKDDKGNITSHLSGVFYRSLNLMEEGVKLVYVFDGKPPEFKSKTNSERRKIRAAAKEKWDEAIARGELKDAKKYAQASVEITSGMLAEAKELLVALGIPVVEAPSEGEAQASYMAKKGVAYAVASSDLDSVLFGAPRLIRNLNITGKRKLAGTNIYKDIKPEIIELKALTESLGIDQEQLINLGILIGTDYNPGGIKGIGPKNALKLVKQYKTLPELMENVEWNFDVSAQQIHDFFLNPPVTDDYDIGELEADRDKIRHILCDRHDFSVERIENMFGKLDKLKDQKKQTTLGRWG